MRLWILAFALSAVTLWAEGWECPSDLNHNRAWRALDSLTDLRYPQGQFLWVLGESNRSVGDAQQVARMELVKRIAGKVKIELEKGKVGGLKSEAEHIRETANFDQMALLHNDADLICASKQSWIAEAHLRLEDYAILLKRAYEDSATVFRNRLQTALQAKDPQTFASAWLRAKSLQGVVAERGLYLSALLADASRGYPVDISAELGKAPFPPFVQDMQLWDRVQAAREQRLQQASVSLQLGPGATLLATPVRNALLSLGVVFKEGKEGQNTVYKLRLQGDESGFESSYGSIWSCEVKGNLELLNAKNKPVGNKVPLQDEEWRETALRDSTLACQKAWGKMAESESFLEMIRTFFRSIAPID